MDGSRLVSSPPPRPVAKDPPNFRPLIYLTLIILLAFCFWKFNSQLSILHSQLSTLTSGSSPTPFPEWMTYTNPEFSFTYPGSWGLPTKTMTGCGSLESITDPDKEYEIAITAKCNFHTATGKKFTTLEDYLKESPSKISYTTIDKTKVAKITSYLASSKSATEIVFMTPSLAIYSVSLGRFTISDYPSPIPAPVLKYFDKILSTLKFSP